MKTAEDVRESLADVRQMKTIKELCDQVGITARAARFYETIGSVAPKRNGKRRFYSPARCREGCDDRCAEAIPFHLGRNSQTPDRNAARVGSLPATPQQCQQQIAFLRVQRQEIERAIVDLTAVQAALATH